MDRPEESRQGVEAQRKPLRIGLTVCVFLVAILVFYETRGPWGGLFYLALGTQVTAQLWWGAKSPVSRLFAIPALTIAVTALYMMWDQGAIASSISP